MLVPINDTQLDKRGVIRSTTKPVVFQVATHVLRGVSTAVLQQVLSQHFSGVMQWFRTLFS
jgi:hypothetical protein